MEHNADLSFLQHFFEITLPTPVHFSLTFTQIPELYNCKSSDVSVIKSKICDYVHWTGINQK